ncbi:MAG: DUF177 domain-containing protein [Verrucomicrobia bacterium]|nr:DUF177 domain-containing protein [Verrucomicrobiota bacterium]MBI3870031.1 DUF177 domain-containing protein [Verrucomicrobiota bacterium]
MAEKPLTVYLSQLERGSVRLEGEAPPELLDLDLQDELLSMKTPLTYSLQVERVGEGILARGSVSLLVHCECARCLKPFEYRLEFPDWACHLSLEGEDQVAVKRDAVDLTPLIREDIVLALPQQPLCDSNCNGLPNVAKTEEKKRTVSQPDSDKKSSVWDALDKLKLS